MYVFIQNLIPVKHKKLLLADDVLVIYDLKLFMLLSKKYL